MVSSRRNPEDDPCADGERHHRCRSWLPKPAHWPRDGRGLDEGRLMRAIQIGASSGVSVRSAGGRLRLPIAIGLERAGSGEGIRFRLLGLGCLLG